MLCAEWWCFEIAVILSGILGVIEQAVFVITFNVIAQLFMFPMGIQEASCAFSTLNSKCKPVVQSILGYISLGQCARSLVETCANVSKM